MLITYETVRAAHRAEKDEKLQSLPENFFEAVKSWLDHKATQRDTTSLLEVENAKKLLGEIISRRERKIFLSALRTVRGELPPTNLTDEEQSFFDRTVRLLKEHREILEGKMFGEEKAAENKIKEAKESLKEIKNSKKMIKILSDVPKFVGIDMAPYGPLKEGEVANLPDDIANLLISRKVAQELL